jgi:hypothetical protein
MLTMQGQQAVFSYSALGWLLEEMLRELPFPCGLAPIWLVGLWEGPLWIRPRLRLAAYEIGPYWPLIR